VKKKRIKISSSKAKGRKLQQWTAKQISKITGLPCGKDEVIESREMGQTGTDIKLYGLAKEKFPFSVECKCQETWSVPAWIKQAKENKIKGTDWLLVFKKNFHEEIVVMDASVFFDLYEQHLTMLFGKNHKLNK
jgi:hypothetical protein